MSRSGTATSYTYDTLDRLTNASGATTLHYGYDAVGNRTSLVDASGTTTSSYDTGDQLISKTGPGGTTSYAFDANGNETTAGTWTYAFNLASQLTSATDGTTTATYDSDGDNNRVTSTLGAVTTSQLWDTNFTLPQLALERDSSASLVRGYIYGDGRISMGTPSTTAYYSADVLGSPTALSGSTGALLGQYDTMPVVAVTAGLTGCAAGIVADMLLHKSVHGAFP